MQKGTMVAVICTAAFLVIGMVIGILAYTKRTGNTQPIPDPNTRNASAQSADKKL